MSGDAKTQPYEGGEQEVDIFFLYSSFFWYYFPNSPYIPLLFPATSIHDTHYSTIHTLSSTASCRDRHYSDPDLNLNLLTSCCVINVPEAGSVKYIRSQSHEAYKVIASVRTTKVSHDRVNLS